jgi:hypothetical protein
MHDDVWPSLPLAEWRATCDTLHMYAQVVGKLRLVLAPSEPEWANVPLYVTARGLTTSVMPIGDRVFSIDFDFIEHKVDVAVSDGQTRSIALLPPRSVADFYAELMSALHSLGIDVTISTLPAEVPNPIRFAEDRQHASYDPEYVNRFFRVLVQVDSVFKEHRAPFRGRHTLVQFFWGTFDLAYARFSGRPATPPSDDVIMRSAMDAEEICAGFWPGDDRFPEPAFWCYAYPKPAGVEQLGIKPSTASWNPNMGEFILRYEDMRRQANPRDALRDFLTSTFDGCAKLAKWDEAKSA